MTHKVVELPRSHSRVSWYIRYPDSNERDCYLQYREGVFSGKCFLRFVSSGNSHAEDRIEGLYKVCMRWEENAPGVCKDVVVNNYRKGRVHMEVRTVKEQ